MKKSATKVTIEVPKEKYVLLETLRETGEVKSVRAGVSEGVDLVILKYADTLERTLENKVNEAQDKEDSVKSALSKVRSENKEE